MFGGLDPKKMQAVMKQMGIKQEEVEASRVIIECSDTKIVIENPSVQKITMQGNVSWQISGEVRESESGIRDEDVRLVAEQAGVSTEKARAALEKHGGDLAKALESLD